MKIVLSPNGTLGDIGPMITLAIKLREQGHQVVMCVPPQDQNLILKYGFEFFSSGSDIKNALNVQAQTTDNKPFGNLKLIKEFMHEIVDLGFPSLLKAAEGADIVFGSGLQYAGKSVAEYYHIPYYHVYHFPLAFPTRFHPPPTVPWQNLPRWANLFMWNMVKRINNQLLKETLNHHRKILKLNPIHDVLSHFRSNSNIIISADERLAPMPFDVTAKHIRTGYWYFHDEKELDKELIQFIEDSSPPVYIGFGSMPNFSRDKVNKMLQEVVNSKGVRLIISKGWADLGERIDAQHVRVIEYAPHSQLFPRMAAVIHHGGSGTTHTAAKAGVPQIIVPHAVDQYYWGEQVYRLRLGPKPIPLPKISGKSLISAINQTISDPQIKKNCHEMAEHLQSKDGVREAAEQLEVLFRTMTAKG